MVGRQKTTAFLFFTEGSENGGFTVPTPLRYPTLSDPFLPSHHLLHLSNTPLPPNRTQVPLKRGTTSRANQRTHTCVCTTPTCQTIYHMQRSRQDHNLATAVCAIVHTFGIHIDKVYASLRLFIPPSHPSIIHQSTMPPKASQPAAGAPSTSDTSNNSSTHAPTLKVKIPKWLPYASRLQVPADKQMVEQKPILAFPELPPHEVDRESFAGQLEPGTVRSAIPPSVKLLNESAKVDAKISIIIQLSNAYPDVSIENLGFFKKNKQTLRTSSGQQMFSTLQLPSPSTISSYSSSDQHPTSLPPTSPSGW